MKYIAQICHALLPQGGSMVIRLVLATFLPSCFASSSFSAPVQNYWLTNPPAVFQASAYFRTNLVPAPRAFRPPSTNCPIELRRALLQFLVAQQYRVELNPETNLVFHHFFPASLSHLVWTNVIAHTNGKSTIVWSSRSRPPGWPEKATEVKWNPNSLLWGMKGFTAISPSWEGEVNPGQVPVTALSRRHGYARGHSMGPSGFGTRFAGKKVWFLTAQNQIVERKVLREVVRTLDPDRLDYTLLLLDRDLPPEIEPLRVGRTNDFSIDSPTRYPFRYKAPYVLFKTEQHANVSAEIPAFTVETWKGGDSGSPNMLPLPGELVFISGRNTSGPTAAMQADMDQLCRLEHLNPGPYQLRWVDFSKFPLY